MKWNLKKVNLGKIREQHPVVYSLILAFFLNLFVETMSRCSLLLALKYLALNPLVYLYNTVIIAFTLSVALLFKRRNFAFFIISMIWMLIGVTDFVLLQFRTTPFTASDLLMVKNVFSIWKYYLSPLHIVLILSLLILLICGCVYFWKKCHRSDNRYSIIKSAIFFGVMLIATLGSTQIGLRCNLLAVNFGNIANAYHDYGLPYCFSSSVINRGIDKPDIYDETVVNQIVDAVENGEIVYASDISSSPEEIIVTPTPIPTPIPTPTEEPELNLLSTRKYPNIIMLQLESFFDPTTIRGVSFTSDPIPTFHKLSKEFTSGYLNVPSVGAGTANTEFEVITGMNLDFFGPGEYPYNTILQKTTCESVNFVLKQLGYNSHAIHDNTGTFYGRNQVFSQLGFDTFTSVEYMQNVELNPTNWAKDFVLTSQIKDTLESTEGKDFIYTISVQGHGSYPEEDILETKLFDVTLPEELQSQHNQILYYSHQIHEMDQFIGELINYLDSLDEDTVLVMYGDHLPGLSLTDENLENGSLYQTPYVMWSNFDLAQDHREMEAYQLYSYVLGRLGITNGLLNKFHQTQQDSDIYLDDLKVLEYDMLYGELNCFNGVNPYTATDIKMGISDITINSVSYTESSTDKTLNTVTITGSNFTPYSKIYINDEYAQTSYQDASTITATNVSLNDGDVITVIQSAEDMVALSSTSPYVFHKTKE